MWDVRKERGMWVETWFQSYITIEEKYNGFGHKRAIQPDFIEMSKTPPSSVLSPLKFHSIQSRLDLSISLAELAHQHDLASASSTSDFEPFLVQLDGIESSITEITPKQLFSQSSSHTSPIPTPNHSPLFFLSQFCPSQPRQFFFSV